MQYVFLSDLFKYLTVTRYAVLMLLHILVIDFHKQKELIICEVLVVSDSQVWFQRSSRVMKEGT